MTGNVFRMEATAGTPGHPGSTRTDSGVGGHVRQLIALAEALTRAAAPDTTASDTANSTGTATTTGSAAGTGAAGGTGPAGGPGAGLVESPLGVDVESLSDVEAVAWAQDLEHLGSILSALQVQVAGDLAGRVLAGRFDGVKTPAELFATALRLDRRAAGRRLRLAGRFLPVRDDLTQVRTPAAQPVAASAFFSGKLSAEQALTASGHIEEAQHLAQGGRITGQEARDLEETLTAHATTLDPDSLTRVGVLAVNLLDPDGQQPTAGELTAKQGITFRQPRKGLVHFEGWATVPQYEIWMAATGSAVNPRPHIELSDINPNGGNNASATAGRGNAANPSNVNSSSNGSNDNTNRISQHKKNNKKNKRNWKHASGGQNNTNGTGGGEVPGQLDLDGLLQGPPPDWALTAAAPPLTPPGHGPTRTGQPEPGPEAPWPHLINGIWVPAPGSGQELPGLDPIDPANTNPVLTDRRTRAQRLLDGMIDCLDLAARTNKLPDNGGLKPQLFISTTEADLQRKTTDGRPGGIAFLPYSGPQPLGLFSTELCDADVTTMLLGNGQEILNVGRTQRFFTKAQRKILIARDKGCSHPGCTRPAYWCDAHHIIPWMDGGETSIENGALLCRAHHIAIHQGLWSIKLTNGTPWYTPAYKLDPTQTPIRNIYHHGLPIATNQTP